jgi:hypothetical protein
MKALLSKAWDWAKRLFGRSKIIFANVMGILAAGWVEIYDPISMLNWDDFTDKHEVAIAIGILVQVLNVFLRTFASSSAVSFRSLQESPVTVVIDPNPPVGESGVSLEGEDVKLEDVNPSPKAN